MNTNLHYNTLTDETRSLLLKLMQLEDPEFKKFALVGGTNLSLRFGHRISVDIGLFSQTDFQKTELMEILELSHKIYLTTVSSGFSLMLNVDGVKVEFIKLAYPLLAPIETIDSIRLYSVPDIIAMKLNAIINRGLKKDFWDVAHLLNYHSLSDMLSFFEKKYSNASPALALHALAYFDDAEMDKDPFSLERITWKKVKEKVTLHLKNYTRQI